MDTDELTIIVTTAVGATPLERDGVLRRLEEAVGVAIAETAPHGYITRGTSDPSAIRLIIDAPALATSPVLSLVGDAINTLMADPDLLGWGPFSINVTDETPDGTGDDDEDDEDGIGIHVEQVDPEPARRRLREAAIHLADALDPRRLTPLDLDSDDPDERARAGTEATYVAGALFTAAIVVVDYLFTDLETLTDTDETVATATARNAAFFIVDNLPDRYSHRYDALFIKQMIVATVDVTRRLTAGWEPLACPAEELALYLILNETDAQLERADLGISGTWRAVVEDALYEGDPASLTRTGATDLAFTTWFAPFSPGLPLPPYLLDQPSSTSPPNDRDPAPRGH